jgi:cytochrome c oxidase subunit 4
MTDQSETSASHRHATIAHVAPLPVLAAVFAALMALTVLTVYAASSPIDFGTWSLWIAMGIAAVKGALVVLYFMHLRYDHPFNAIIFIVALLFVAVFISITLLDVVQYQPDIINAPKSTGK